MNERNTKWPLEYYHSNSCCEQVPPVTAKSGGCKFEQNGILVQFQVSTSKILTNYLENNNNLIAQKLIKCHLKLSG